MNKYRATIEIQIPKDPLKYINYRPKEKISQAMLNELVRAQVTDDLSEALRLHGMQAEVKLTRKVQNVK